MSHVTPYNKNQVFASLDATLGPAIDDELTALQSAVNQIITIIVRS
jgi:hypothetical protein